MITDDRKNKVYIGKDIYALSLYNNISLPLNIDYEHLDRVLHDRINRKYNIIDNRSCKIVQMPNSGLSNHQNQSGITFEEPYTKETYPLSTIPYSQGVIWE